MMTVMGEGMLGVDLICEGVMCECKQGKVRVQ